MTAMLDGALMNNFHGNVGWRYLCHLLGIDGIWANSVVITSAFSVQNYGLCRWAARQRLSARADRTGSTEMPSSTCGTKTSMLETSSIILTWRLERLQSTAPIAAERLRRFCVWRPDPERQDVLLWRLLEALRQKAFRADDR